MADQPIYRRGGVVVTALPQEGSATAVADWLEHHLPDAWGGEAANAAREKNLTAAGLLRMTEDQAAEALGVTVFGRKRKLSLLLGDAKAAVSTTTNSNTTTNSAAGSSADPGSSSANRPAPPSGEGASSSGSSSAASSGVQPDEPALDAAACEAQLHDESYALSLVKWGGAKLQGLLAKPEHAAWATPALRAAKLKELDGLCAQTSELPGVSIVVVGNTGAGKSTLLNALLGEASILPTNGMRACTACLIEMRHEDPDPARSPPMYRAEIEFMTQQEWDKELADLLDDLTPNDGPNQGRVNLSVSEDSMAYGSWCKVFAVYGEDFTHSRVRTDRTGPGGRVVYDNPTLESLRAKLSRCRAITHALSTVKQESASDARTFRSKIEMYMDSASDVSGGSFWPIVKQVRLFSRAWSTLRTGAVLVDAPGVHDDNSARDAVVKTKLKNADAVWIVSNIVRAVNDKTAKDLLGEQFRRQLLMDGQFGSLAFIATQSDVIQRGEAIRALGLPEAATLQQCARARNEYTAKRLARDFKAGLREMARDAGEGASGAEALAAKHSLPVFTVSSVEYQKLAGLRSHDGDARVWSDVEHTQIPSLVRYVQRAALVRRKALSLRRCEGMRDFTAALLSLLKHEERLPQATRDAAKRAFDAQSATLTQELSQHAGEAEARIKKSFEDDVAPKLDEGASQAKTDALTTAQQWGVSNTQGGLHWATYKATTRRMGVWRINMNEELVEPIFKSVATQWERSFLSGLSSTLDDLHTKVSSSLARFHPALLAALKAADVPESASSALGGAQTDGLLTSLRATVGDIKTAAQKQQRDLSRSMEPTVQTQMTPGYTAATAEAGTGSHRRRVAKLEAHIEAEAPRMFRAATDGVVQQMSGLSGSIGRTLQADVVRAAHTALRTAYCPLWDELADKNVQARRKLVPTCSDVLLETKNAVRRLVEGGRGGGGGGGVAQAAGGHAGEGDDDDLVDMTDAQQQAKRARQAKETVDIDDLPMGEGDEEHMHLENEPPQGVVGGKAKVKAEVKAEM